MERLDSAFFKLLDELIIARSRKHIQKYYDLTEIGEFPRREKPLAVYPTIDTENIFISYNLLNEEIQKYELSLFNPSKYVQSEHKDKYEFKIRNFTQEGREWFLIGMMKVNFLKRLESSVHSFAVSMERTVNKINSMENKIHEFKAQHYDRGRALPEHPWPGNSGKGIIQKGGLNDRSEDTYSGRSQGISGRLSPRECPQPSQYPGLQER